MRSGRYSSPSEVMREALRLLEEHKLRRRDMEEEIRRGIHPGRKRRERPEDEADAARA